MTSDEIKEWADKNRSTDAQIEWLKKVNAALPGIAKMETVAERERALVELGLPPVKPATDAEIAEWNPAGKHIAAAVYPWRVAKLIARISSMKAEAESDAAAERDYLDTLARLKPEVELRATIERLEQENAELREGFTPARREKAGK